MLEGKKMFCVQGLFMKFFVDFFYEVSSVVFL